MKAYANFAEFIVCILLDYVIVNMVTQRRSYIGKVYIFMTKAGISFQNIVTEIVIVCRRAKIIYGKH